MCTCIKLPNQIKEVEKIWVYIYIQRKKFALKSVCLSFYSWKHSYLYSCSTFICMQHLAKMLCLDAPSICSVHFACLVLANLASFKLGMNPKMKMVFHLSLFQSMLSLISRTVGHLPVHFWALVYLPPCHSHFRLCCISSLSSFSSSSQIWYTDNMIYHIITLNVLI